MGYVILGAIGTVLLFILFNRYGSCRKPVRTAFISMTSGAASLIVASIVLGIAGYTLTVNLFSTATSLILGIPGTVLLIIKTLIS